VILAVADIIPAVDIVPGPDAARALQFEEIVKLFNLSDLPDTYPGVRIE
jgi:hypothetical protein